MSNLQNVDAIQMFAFFGYGFAYDSNKNVFEKLNIKTIEDLEFAMKKYPNLFNFYDYCETVLLKTKLLEEKYTLKPQDSTSYFGDLSMLSKSSIQASEEKTKGDELLLCSLVGQFSRNSFNCLLDLNVSQIKNLFYYQNRSSKPLILKAAKIGAKNLQAIINAIKFFDAQIVRQNDEAHIDGADLFHLNYEGKRVIVLEEIESYIDYLEENAKNCVWGPNTETKIRFMREAFRRQNEAAIRNRERLINTFTNYLTLSELESGVVKNKTLERFIV